MPPRLMRTSESRVSPTIRIRRPSGEVAWSAEELASLAVAEASET